jgi:hypothetical protein
MTRHVVRETGIERSKTTVSVPSASFTGDRKEYFENIVTCMCVTLDGVLDWILNLLTTLPYNWELQAITALPLISAIHKSPQHPLSLFQPAVSSPAVPW